MQGAHGPLFFVFFFFSSFNDCGWRGLAVGGLRVVIIYWNMMNHDVVKASTRTSKNLTIDFTNHHVFVINVSLQWGVGTPCVPLMRDITYCGEKTPPREISNGRRRDIFISSGPQGLNASQNQYVLSADAQNESLHNVGRLPQTPVLHHTRYKSS